MILNKNMRSFVTPVSSRDLSFQMLESLSEGIIEQSRQKLSKLLRTLELRAMQSETERARSRELHSRVIWVFKQRDTSENFDFFFNMAHGTRNVSFWGYN